jgi:hypothetical protein
MTKDVQQRSLAYLEQVEVCHSIFLPLYPPTESGGSEQGDFDAGEAFLGAVV